MTIMGAIAGPLQGEMQMNAALVVLNHESNAAQARENEQEREEEDMGRAIQDLFREQVAQAHVAVQAAPPPEEVTCDKYRSNKGTPWDVLPEEIRNKPIFRVNGCTREVTLPGLITPYVKRISYVTDEDLLKHLQLEALYVPRTPTLALVLKTKAKKWISQFNTTLYSRDEMLEIIANAVHMAYIPSQYDAQFVETVMNIKVALSISTHNSCFSDGHSFYKAGTGPVILSYLPSVCTSTKSLLKYTGYTALSGYLLYRMYHAPLSRTIIRYLSDTLSQHILRVSATSLSPCIIGTLSTGGYDIIVQA